MVCSKPFEPYGVIEGSVQQERRMEDEERAPVWRVALRRESCV